MEQLPRHRGACARVENGGIARLCLIVHNTIFFAEFQLLFPTVFFRDIVQDASRGGRVGILAPGLGQHDRLALAADDVRDTVGVEEGISFFAQPAQLRQRVVAAADDLAVHRVAEQPRAQTQGETLANLA